MLKKIIKFWPFSVSN